MSTKLIDAPRDFRRSVVTTESVYKKAKTILKKQNSTVSTFCHDALKKLIEENKK